MKINMTEQDKAAAIDAARAQLANATTIEEMRDVLDTVLEVVAADYHESAGMPVGMIPLPAM